MKKKLLALANISIIFVMMLPPIAYATSTDAETQINEINYEQKENGEEIIGFYPTGFILANFWYMYPEHYSFGGFIIYFDVWASTKEHGSAGAIIINGQNVNSGVDDAELHIGLLIGRCYSVPDTPSTDAVYIRGFAIGIDLETW